MLAYTAGSRGVAARRSNPNAMLIVIGAHVAAVAVLMSAKMELPIRPNFDGTTITFVPIQPDPPPIPIKPEVPQPPQLTIPRVHQPRPGGPLEQQSDQTLDPRPKVA